MSALFNTDTENIDLDEMEFEAEVEVGAENVEAWMMEMLSGPDND